MEDFELITTPDGSKIPKAAALGTEDSWFGHGPQLQAAPYLRAGWEMAKKEGRLTGCGLMGNMTMDDIEELEQKVKVAMGTWARLAGTTGGSWAATAKTPEEKPDSSIFDFVKQLMQDVTKLTKEVKDLRKMAELRVIEQVKAGLEQTKACV